MTIAEILSEDAEVIPFSKTDIILKDNYQQHNPGHEEVYLEGIIGGAKKFPVYNEVSVIIDEKNNLHYLLGTYFSKILESNKGRRAEYESEGKKKIEGYNHFAPQEHLRIYNWGARPIVEFDSHEIIKEEFPGMLNMYREEPTSQERRLGGFMVVMYLQEQFNKMKKALAYIVL